MNRYSKEFLQPLVKESRSYRDLLLKLNLKVCGGNHRTVRTKVLQYGIDTTHFLGKGWAKNLVGRKSSKKWSDEKVFKLNSGYPTSKLYKRLINIGVENKCSCCGIDSWNERPIRLQADHINGNHNDNRLDNLRLLCPNCHSQTETWGSGETANALA